MIDKGKRQGSEKMTSEAEKAEDASSIVSLFIYLFIYLFFLEQDRFKHFNGAASMNYYVVGN
jgi:hypothetical protein